MYLIGSHPIVSNPNKLSQHWAQSVIDSQFSGSEKIKIGGIDIVSIDVGTTTRIRLALEHDGDGLLPKRWFVKLPSLSYRAKAITALPRLLPTEIRFYNELAGQIPVPIPKPITAYSRFGIGSILAIADVTETGGKPGQAGQALSAEQALQVAGQLARLHAGFCGKANSDKRLGWLAGPVRQLEDLLGTAMAVPLMKRGLQLAGGEVPENLHRPALDYARLRKRVMQFLAAAEPTLVHHDCHPGNLYWQNGQPGFLDWQMVRMGEGIGDISYFMATALTPEVRRACETDVLHCYYDAMRPGHGLSSSFAQLCERYRAHLSYAFEAMVVTLAVGGLMPLDSNLEMIRRTAAAVADHESFALLSKIS